MSREISSARSTKAPFVYAMARPDDLAALVRMGKKLWPHVSAGELRSEFNAYIHSKKDCLIIAGVQNKRLIGFIHGSLRYEYVEGAQSSPVGYIEGLFVQPRFRRQGVARDLVRMFEQWALSHHCDTFASDTEDSNQLSQRVHRALGYQAAQTVVHFIKKA